MSVSRRNVLKVIGGGTIIAATGVGGFALTRTPDKSLAPWSAAGGYDEPRRRALSYAILAPNPHNRQPWLVDLSEPDTIIVHRDGAKNLPETDPYDRQLTIGMGCFLEQLAVAASETGHGVDFELFPDGEGGPVAIARMRADAASKDPLADFMMSRRSCKEPFTDQPVSPDPRLTSLAEVYIAPNVVARLREFTIEAFRIETHTHRTMKESVDLFRMGKSEIEANPDGIDLGGPFLETLMLIGSLTRDGQLDPSSTEFKQGYALYNEMLTATPAYAVIRTAQNTRIDQIEAGRRWLRLNLTTTALGLSLHPVSQALQEYPEMSGVLTKIHDLLAEGGETVQMLGRLGHGPIVPPSPRWPLDKKVIRV